MDETQWKRVFDSFPVNREMIWLNNCGTTSPSENVLKEVFDFLNGYAKEGIFTSAKNYETTYGNIKKHLSSLLKCSSSELALIHNTSEGMNLVSYGLRLQKGDTILLLENEYPSNVYPWEHWEGKNVELRFIPIGKNPAEFLKSFQSLVDDNVKVVSLSLVHWCTGMPLPVKEISDICRQHEIALILDGAQGVGHLDINLNELDIFAMAFPAWKWLLGPLGLGVLYINQKKINNLDYVFKGQNSVIDADNYLPYRNSLKEGASRYEYSTPAFLEWVYFEAALEFINNLGFANVKSRILELSSYLQEALRTVGYSIFSDNFPDSPTGIVVFEHQNLESKQIFTELQKHKIIGALRLDRIRFSPHIYNSFDQLDRVVSILKKIN